MLKNYGNANWNLCKVNASLASTCSLCNLALIQTQHQQQAAGSRLCLSLRLRRCLATRISRRRLRRRLRQWPQSAARLRFALIDLWSRS